MKSFSEWVSTKEAAMATDDADQLSQMGLNPRQFGIRKDSWLSRNSELPRFKTKGDTATYHPDYQKGPPQADDYFFVKSLHPVFDAIRSMRPDLNAMDVWTLIRHSPKAALMLKKTPNNPEEHQQLASDVAQSILTTLQRRFNRLRGARN